MQYCNDTIIARKSGDTACNYRLFTGLDPKYRYGCVVLSNVEGDNASDRRRKRNKYIYWFKLHNDEIFLSLIFYE